MSAIEFKKKTAAADAKSKATTAATTQVVPVKFKVDLDHYSPDETDCVWVHIFSQRLLDKETKKQVVLSKEVEIDTYMKQTIPSSDDFLHVDIYVKRILDAKTQEIHDGKSWEYARSAQPFVDRVGFGTITVAEAEKGTTRPLLDILKNVIGHFKLKMVGREVGKYRVQIGSGQALQRFTMDDQPMPELTKLVTTELRRIHADWKESNLTPTLRRFQFATRPQPCGQMPICAFPLLRLMTPATAREKEETTDYLLHAQRVAKFLLGIDNPANPIEQAALLNEMRVLPTVAGLYVPDVTRTGKDSNAITDDWASPGDSPVPSLLALDCENAMLQILQEDHLLRCDAELKKTALGKFAAGYYTFGVGMTLYLPSKKEWVYHATTMQLDRKYVLHHLLVRGGGKTKGDNNNSIATTREQQQQPSFQPSNLGEGTCYSTGPWGYKYTDREERDLAASRLVFSGGRETITKFTPSVLRSKGIYGHVQTLFSPQLFEEMQICQIELGHKGKLGVPAELLMECSLDPDIEFRPIAVPQQRLDAIKKEIEVFRGYYPKTPLPKAPLTPFRPPADTKDRIANFFIRNTDYHGDETLDELEHVCDRTLKAFPLQIRQGLSIMYVYALPDEKEEDDGNGH